jgi:tRNA pseudouridine38-40 synthase
MRNIKLRLEYDGTNYAGWQIQKNAHTIQGILQNRLAETLQEDLKLIGAGRTDSGVHARGQVANFKTGSKLSLKAIHNALNSRLPQDIRAIDVQEALLEFHAQYDAKAKLYRYSILNHKICSPFKRFYYHHIPYRLDVAKMVEESMVLIGRHDFRSFQAVDKKTRSSIRTVRKLQIKEENYCLYVDIEADGFLYNMVRNIVGTLIETGRGKMPVGSMKRILEGRDRTLAGPTAPARGLCLMEVKY